jgi:hypothetical protein
MECSGGVDPQGLGQFLDGGTQAHEPDVLLRLISD